MSNLIIIHRAYQDLQEHLFLNNNIKKNLSTEFLMWQTCRREIYFLDESELSQFYFTPTDETYIGLDAEEFLVQVLCGLKSPLVGETEVFGQFKIWWQNLIQNKFKLKFDVRIQQIYSIVKKIREDSLCGLGSQSYGSLLRKKISENLDIEPNAVIDFLGAGQLVEEIVPWVQKKWSYRIWCRNPERVKKFDIGLTASQVLQVNEKKQLASVLVVAAPFEHNELTNWIQGRISTTGLKIYDFRHDSMSFNKSNQFQTYLHLDHFTTEVAAQKSTIQNHIKKAYTRIENWKDEEKNRAQIRPFGWDDL